MQQQPSILHARRLRQRQHCTCTRMHRAVHHCSSYLWVDASLLGGSILALSAHGQAQFCKRVLRILPHGVHVAHGHPPPAATPPWRLRSSAPSIPLATQRPAQHRIAPAASPVPARRQSARGVALHVHAACMLLGCGSASIQRFSLCMRSCNHPPPRRASGRRPR